MKCKEEKLVGQEKTASGLNVLALYNVILYGAFVVVFVQVG